MADRHDEGPGDPGDQSDLIARDGDVGVVTLRGEVDISTDGGLDDAVDEAVAVGLSHLVIDLAEVTFMGSSGLASLLRAQRLLGEGDATLELREPSQTVRDLLAMTHLTDRFTISSDTGT